MGEEEEDPYWFVVDEAYISFSQDQILRSIPFFGADDLNAPHDVFLTPPEGLSSLDADLCAVNRAFDFVDLDSDDEFGFSQPHPTPPLIHLPDLHDQSRQSSLKKLKLSDNDLGFGPAGECSGLKLQNVQEGKGKGKLLDADGGDAGSEEDFCKEIPMENNGKQAVIQSENETVLGEGSEKKKLSTAFDVFKVLNEGEDTSGGEGEDEDDGLGLVRAATLRGWFRDSNTGSGEAEDDSDGLGLLRAARVHGITFPRPRWWPKDADDKFDILKICDKES